jgi:signal transduction histidine kinase
VAKYLRAPPRLFPRLRRDQAALWELEIVSPRDNARLTYLVDRLRWLVRLRWIAIAGIAVTIAATSFLGIVREPMPLIAIAFAMAMYNFGFWRWSHRASESGLTAAARTVFSQIVLDCAALAFLLHLSGGIGNPFAMFFAFQVAIGAMLLRVRDAIKLGVVSVLAHSFFVVGKHAGVLEHHPLYLGGSEMPFLSINMWGSPGFVVGYLSAFVMMQFGVIYFVQSIAARHRRAEAEREERGRVALSRERLARIGELSAGVAHSVRNPLHGVMNCVEILKSRAGGGGETMETLALMGEGLERIEGVTRRLLVATREDPPRRARANLNDIVQDAIQFVEARAGQAGVVLEVGLGRVPLVEIDAGRVSEALLNVIDNALHATPAGGVVSVTTVEELNGVSFGRLVVRDTGKGIAGCDLPRVFDPFYTSKGVGEGTGLGLAITRRIVEEHGGTVSVESEVGVGTVVTMRFPGVRAGSD